MRTAFLRPAARIPVYSQAGLRLAAFRVGRAQTAEKAEGKIKEDGTMSDRFGKLLLSAHWLAGPRAAPWFWRRSAAIFRNALALLDFDRHHGHRMLDFVQFWPEARP